MNEDIEARTHVGNLFGKFCKHDEIQPENEIISTAQASLQSVVSDILEQARRHMNADGCIMEMVEGDDMVCRAIHRLPEKYIGIRTNKNDCLSGLCIQMNEVLSCENAATDERVNTQMCLAVGIGAMIVAPMTVPTLSSYEVLGTLKVFYYDAREIRSGQKSVLLSSAQTLSSAINDISNYVFSALRSSRVIEDDFNVLDSLPMIAWAAAPSGQIIYYSRKWYEYTGQSVREAFCCGWHTAVHPDDLQHCIDVTDEGILNSHPYEVLVRLRRHSDQEYRWHIVRATPTFTSAGEVVRWAGSTTDIHDFYTQKSFCK